MADFATMGVEADIRKDLYARLQILPMSFHGRWRSGLLLSRIMKRPQRYPPVAVVRLVLLMLKRSLQIAIVTAILLAMYWPLGVVLLVSGGAGDPDDAALRALVHRTVPPLSQDRAGGDHHVRRPLWAFGR